MRLISYFLEHRNILDTQELKRLKEALEDDKGVISQVYSRDDGAGRRSKTVLWNNAGSDITGIIARAEKVAGTFEKVGQVNL